MGYWDKETKPAVEDQERQEDRIDLETVESATLEELGEVEKGFRERMKQGTKRFRDMCDTEYWIAVCFTGREQKEEFLRKIGMETDLKYVEGREMAKAYKKSIKTPDMEFAGIRPFDKDYVNRAMEK